MKTIFVEKTASRGIAVAPVVIYQPLNLSPATYAIAEDQVEVEIQCFYDARQAVATDLAVLAETNEIFGAHLEIANDFMLEEGIKTKIQFESQNVQQAVTACVDELAAMFLSLDDEYMQARGADVQDVGMRIMASLKGQALPDLGAITQPSIVVAKDLFPSDTVKLNPAVVKGILTQEGGVTGHVSILAGSMQIPILVGVTDILNCVTPGSLVCMDGETGAIAVDPTDEIKESFLAKQAQYAAEKDRLAQLRTQPLVNQLGKPIHLCANIGDLKELEVAMTYGIDGVGLFRSELLYMEGTHFPTEDEQFAVYKQAAQMSPKELTIRTLDIGGDKALPYYTFEHEDNPFLGWRAIRISLTLRDMFKDQLRAILRASAFGNVRILLPMIISMEELNEARVLIAQCMEELELEGKEFNHHIPVGIMVETPASVLLAGEFAKACDFFSIGTNDLTQYLLAVDRGNPKIAHLCNYFHPAVVKAIEMVIDAGHKENIPVGMCGEMAGDTKATRLLLDLGLDEFSMSAGSIDFVRGAILG